MAALTVMVFGVAAAPMTRVPAVIVPSSVVVRPSWLALSAPPTLMAMAPLAVFVFRLTVLLPALMLVPEARSMLSAAMVMLPVLVVLTEPLLARLTPKEPLLPAVPVMLTPPLPEEIELGTVR